MKNLWLCAIPTSIAILIVFGGIIYAFVKHSKINIFLGFCLIIVFVGSLIGMWPFYKDICQRETITFEGTYSDYHNAGIGLALSSKNTFETDDNEIDVYISNFQYSKYNLHKGSKYRITYYKNSHAVHSIELIE